MANPVSIKFLFNKFFKSYILNGYVSSYNAIPEKRWTPKTDYTEGDVVIHIERNNNETINYKYIALNTAKSGSKAPTHNGKGEAKTDGGVRWLFVEKDSYAGSGLENMYISFGKPFSNAANIPSPLISPEYVRQWVKQIIYARRIEKNNIALVVNRNTWKTGTVFDRYSATTYEYANPHYTTNSQGQIYYCINNNKGQPSQIEPIGESSNPITLMDGYAWMYAGKLTTGSTRFLTDEYMPISRDIEFSPYYDDSLGGISYVEVNNFQAGTFTDPNNVEAIIEYTVNVVGKEAILKPIINTSGVVTNIEIVDPGSDYTSTAKVRIQEKNVTGKNAQVQITKVENGEIKEVSVINGGTGYVNAVITFHSETGNGAEATVEVSATGQVTNIIITNGGTGYTDTNNEAYIIAGTAGMMCQADVFHRTADKADFMSSFGECEIMLNVELDPDSSYFPSNTIYNQIMLMTNCHQEDGQLCDKEEYLGEANPLFNTPASLNMNKFSKSKGFCLYIQNMNDLTRVANQMESLQLLIEL